MFLRFDTEPYSEQGGMHDLQGVYQSLSDACAAPLAGDHEYSHVAEITQTGPQIVARRWESGVAEPQKVIALALRDHEVVDLELQTTAALAILAGLPEHPEVEPAWHVRELWAARLQLAGMQTPA